MNLYSVRSSYRRDGGAYDIHRTDNVLADDLMDAARHVQAKRPGAHIWTVAHKGHVNPDMVTTEARADITDEHP